MSAFSEKIKTAINECGVPIARLAERSGMSASMLYKIQNGTRLPDSLEALEQLLDAMLCGLPQRKELLQFYMVERIGVGRYAAFNALKDMLADLADPTPVTAETSAGKHVLIPPAVTGLENVNAVVRTVMEQETAKEGGELALLVPPHYGYCLETLSQALKDCSPGFRGAHQMFCLRASATDDALLYNMDVIRRILPKMLMIEHYDPWYCYLPDPHNGIVPFPFFICTMDCVLLLSGDLESAVYLRDEKIHDLYLQKCDQMRQNFRPVMQSGSTSLAGYLEMHHWITAESKRPLVPVTMSAAPCIMPCIRREAIGKYLPDGLITNRDAANLEEYFRNSQKNGYVCFFTVRGMEYLIEHGHLTEVQGPEIPEIDREDVLDALEAFIIQAKAGRIVPRIFRQEIFPASARLCMALYESKLVTVCEMPKRSAVFLDITEATVSHVLREYAENALTLGDVYSPAESIRIMEDVIRRYRG